MGTKVRMIKDGEKLVGWDIFCPACKELHRFVPGPRYRGDQIVGPGWAFNGNLELPTFTPSMNISWGPFPEGSQWAGQIIRCHFVITDGKLVYCSDSTHGLSGQTIDLPDLQ